MFRSSDSLLAARWNDPRDRAASGGGVIGARQTVTCHSLTFKQIWPLESSYLIFN